MRLTEELLQGNAAANMRLLASGLPKPPNFTIIDRIYIEGGNQLIGGLSMNTNKKEQPVVLKRDTDYFSHLQWISVQPVVFYDVSDQRAWLVDGASALLHVVRASLYRDAHDPVSPYHWVFDAERFGANVQRAWDGCLTGRQAAIRVLKDWDNLEMPVYGTSRTEFSTLWVRVSKILHALDIIIDYQAKLAYQDGIKIAQTLDPRQGVTGFDVLDIISPPGPIYPRIIRNSDPWNQGWVELVCSTGITAIFGNGFGDLLRPRQGTQVCRHWQSMPLAMNYLATSVTTLRMVYEEHLLRVEPSLGIGQLTGRLIWSSSRSPFDSCKQCSHPRQQKQHRSPQTDAGGDRHAHHDPVQFLTAKKSSTARHLSQILSKPSSPPSVPVDIRNLQQNGAIIFGHQSFLSQILSRGHRQGASEDVAARAGSSSVLDSSASSRSLTSRRTESPSTCRPQDSSVPGAVSGSVTTRESALTGVTQPDGCLVESRAGTSISGVEVDGSEEDEDGRQAGGQPDKVGENQAPVTGRRKRERRWRELSTRIFRKH